MTKPSDWHLGMTFFAFDWRLWGDEIRSGGCRFRVDRGPSRFQLLVSQMFPDGSISPPVMRSRASLR